MIRVAVIDGMPLFRRGAIEAIQEDPGLEVVAQAADGPAALTEIVRARPDVAVLEVGIPGLGGPEIMRGLSRAGCDTKVILNGAHPDPATVRLALTSGVSGYVSKHDDENVIRTAIATVAHGGAVIPDNLRIRVVEQLTSTGEGHFSRLSGREHSTLELLAAGRSSKQIGFTLSLSESTVKTYQRRLYDKLQVTSRSGAVAEGLRRGLID